MARSNLPHGIRRFLRNAEPKQNPDRKSSQTGKLRKRRLGGESRESCCFRLRQRTLNRGVRRGQTRMALRLGRLSWDFYFLPPHIRAFNKSSSASTRGSGDSRYSPCHKCPRRRSSARSSSFKAAPSQLYIPRLLPADYTFA